jgi:hypothetical protein
MRQKYLYMILLSPFLFASCNPFAPGLDDSSEGIFSVLGDQRTTEGVFQNLQYAYTMKDTTIYGQLFDGNYEFVYTDFDLGMNLKWQRQEELWRTHVLFEHVQRLDLIWNETNSSFMSGDSTQAIIDRTFDLTVVFSADDKINIDGNAIFEMQRQKVGEPWLITRWTDGDY